MSNFILGQCIGLVPRKTSGVPELVHRLCGGPKSVHKVVCRNCTVCSSTSKRIFQSHDGRRRSLPTPQPQPDARNAFFTQASYRGSQIAASGSGGGNKSNASPSTSVPQAPADPPGHGGRATGKTESLYKDINALDSEILSIGLPMLAALAADPIAGLVDSAYMGRAGSAQLAAVGVALSIFNTATKLFNVPLLAVTTSAVAKASGELSRALEAAVVTTATAATTEAAANNSTKTATTRMVPAVLSGTVSATGMVVDEGSAAVVATAEAAEAVEASVAAANLAQARAASACIWLALLVGVLQAVVLIGTGPRLIALWGVSASSSINQPALSFLLVRAVGAPVTILMLTLQGVFRGLQDTRTPLQVTLMSNALNIALGPILIFGAGWGAAGAAVATVTAQVIPLILMARELRKRLGLGEQRALHQQGQRHLQEEQLKPGLDRPAIADTGGDGRSPTATSADSSLLKWLWSLVADVLPLFKPTGFLVLRSASVTATYAVATTLVAKAGAVVTASHQICFQLWLACSLLADALAVAAQSMMARDLGAGSVGRARQVAARVSSLGLGLGLVLALVLAAGGRGLPGIFSSDPEVLRLVAALFPVIAATQPITVLAMTWDGVLYGAGGFRYAALSMAAAALPAIAVMQLGGGLIRKFTETLRAGVFDVATGAATPLAGDEQLWLVWAGLGMLMLLRWLTIAVPYVARIGPFRHLRTENK